MTTNLWPEPPPFQGAFRLAPLTGELADLDTRAYLESPDAITAHSAGRWSVKGFTREENLRLIESHERQHEAGEAFTYALLSPGKDQQWGCVYLRPLKSFLRRSSTKLALDPIVMSDAVIVTLWLIDDTAERPAAAEVGSARSLAPRLEAGRGGLSLPACRDSDSRCLDRRRA